MHVDGKQWKVLKIGLDEEGKCTDDSQQCHEELNGEDYGRSIFGQYSQPYLDETTKINAIIFIWHMQ